MRKQQLFETAILERDMIFAGCQLEMKEDTMFQQAAQLAKEYAKVKPLIKHLRTPVYTAVINAQKNQKGTYLTFMGDEIEQFSDLDDMCNIMQIKRGTMIAKTQVKVGTQMTLSYRVAAIRKAFYTQWLPQSTYTADEVLADMELYHYRRRRFRKSTKMVMALYFFIQPSQSVS